MKKRIFAALLCVIMLFGMLPITRWQQNQRQSMSMRQRAMTKIMVPKTSLMRQLKRL